jgi:cephalosporin hydroxylase
MRLFNRKTEKLNSLTKERTPLLSPAAAIWNNRAALAEMLPALRETRATLQEMMGGPRDFVHQQWLQIASLIYEFQPDLIIELGRGYGNSTCAMAIGAHQLGSKLKLLSICLTTNFIEESRPYLTKRVRDPISLSISLVDARVADIINYDFGEEIRSAKRVFVFWDAHGFEVASAILQKVIKPLADKEHCVLVHDMADMRFFSQAHRSYAPEPWAGTGTAPPKFIFGDVGTQYEEGLALIDFLGRNQIPFRSAESSYFPELTERHVYELVQLFGNDFSRYGFWYYFSLNERRSDALTFP